MNIPLKICFIGYGNMAKALIQGLSDKKNYQIFVSAPSLSQGRTKTGIVTDKDNCALLENADMVILAVKPQQILSVLQEIKPALSPDTLVVSIAAGLSLSFFQSQLPPKQALVCAMPNIAVAYREGAIPLIGNALVTPKQRIHISAFFDHLGLTSWLDSEKEMDIYTALSDSGPAYVFLFLEALQKGAQNLGLTSKTAAAFSCQTLSGALSYLKNTGLDPETARKLVTSHEGTTAAAIATLKKGDFGQLIAEAMQAAFMRARELGKQK